MSKKNKQNGGRQRKLFHIKRQYLYLEDFSSKEITPRWIYNFAAEDGQHKNGKSDTSS